MYPAVIAVHCGAGIHNTQYHSDYKKLCKLACLKAIETLNKGGSALEAVRDAIIVLENNPRTNCGYGSNLTIDGEVENDASIMNGENLLYGGCGGVKRLKNPICLAYDLCVKQTKKTVLGLVPPSLLVGHGALVYAKDIGLKIVNSKAMISTGAAKKHKRYLQVYKDSLENENQQELRLDTVGAVCMDTNGNFAAGCSSGGIILKRPGRIGQSALYASGTWADSATKELEPSIAVCTSGCGEHLVRTQLSREVANDLKFHSCPATGLHKSLTDKYLNSKYLHNVDQKLCGVLVLHRNEGDVSIVWGHSSETMSIGFMRSVDEKPESFISELPVRSRAGSTVNVGGKHYTLEPNE